MRTASNERTVCLLGPQRHEPNLGEIVERLGLGGPFAVVTAGWEEREREIEELAQHLAPFGPIVPLDLSRRVEDLFAADPELRRMLDERNGELRRVQEFYRLRLRHALSAARELLALAGRAPGREQGLELEIESAIAEARDLDVFHLARIRAIREEWHERIRLDERPAAQRAREGVRREMEKVSALLVAGGHVAILRNRLALLEPHAHLGTRPLIAWSAGAMVATERIVLFHDHPPQGAGDPEVYEKGLGLVRGVVALPHAEKRLRLADRSRVRLFASRFAPDTCLALDRGAFALLRGDSVELGPRTRVLQPGGEVTAPKDEVAA